MKSLLRYNRRTGEWTWLTTRGRVKAGSAAGSPDGQGYLIIQVMGRRYKAHRLAFLYVKGRLPDDSLDVDHKDTNPSNNRWKNLREVSQSVNQQNRRRAQSDNQTGFQGVSPHKDGKFVAQIRIKGVVTYLGLFDTPKTAHQAYLKAKRKFHKGNTL